jgi:hypothetical protein
VALISNIHFGLNAWASGSFALGQRCSNAGNAYQCTTAGSSTVAPTGTGAGINNGGAAVFKYLSSIDYTTLQAWANALPATLTQPVVASLWNDAPYTTTAGAYFLVLSGNVTTASNNITIQPAPGEGFATTLAANPALPLAFNSANGVSFVLPAAGVGGINYFLISDDNVVIQGIQFQDPNPTSGSTIIQPTQNCLVSGCIFDGYSQVGGAFMIDASLSGASTSVFTFTNNLVIDRAAPTDETSTLSTTYISTFANNTFVSINSSANLACILDNSTAAGVTLNQTNNMMLGYTNPALVTTSGNTASVLNVQYGLFTASSLTGGQVVAGAGNVYSQAAANQFVNPASNFRLLAASAGTGTGFTDTADIPSAVDILGNPRTGAWDIGAYQLMTPTSYGTANGHATVAGAALGARSIGTANGHATVAGVPGGGGLITSVGTANGHATASGVSTANISSGTANGRASVIAYDAQGALYATISLANPGTQVIGTPFQVSGTLTLTPELQFSDDASGSFSPIPVSGVSALGSTTFTFTHPGVAAIGEQNLLVEDLSTDASAAVNYAVTSTVTTTNIPTIVGVGIGASLTALGSIIPAYVYQQYADDDNIRAFFTAYNTLAQAYLDWFNGINLPIYTGLSGALLDWVAQGLYGMPRPVLALVQNGALVGPFNTYQLNQIPIDGLSSGITSTVFPVTDDIFKRILTWAFYKGDGFTFSVPWLKRRVARFLAGVNGTDYDGSAAQISIAYPGNGVVNITISTGVIQLTAAAIFQAAVLSGVLVLPFQYTFNVLINSSAQTTTGSNALDFSKTPNSDYMPSVFGF